MCNQKTILLLLIGLVAAGPLVYSVCQARCSVVVMAYYAAAGVT